MSCTGVTTAISVNASSNGQFTAPTVKQGTCGVVTNPDPSPLSGGQVSAWYWSGTLQNVLDGIIEIAVTNAPNQANTDNTHVRRWILFSGLVGCLLTRIQVTDRLLIRKGNINNAMVFPNSDYDGHALTSSGGKYMFTHKALGADAFRYTWDYGQTWSSWQAWEANTTVDGKAVASSGIWSGQHIVVQCQWTHRLYFLFIY
jgi:alpha-1,3-glucan synthase